MRTLRWTFVPLLLLAACGGGSSKPPVEEPDPEPKVVKKQPPPPPPPVCVRAGTEVSLINSVEADDTSTKFCVSDGAESNLCYSVDLGSKKYEELAEAPSARGQSPVLEPEPARVETSPKEVTVCIGETCSTFKPKIKGSDNQIDAVVNAAGTHIAISLGNAEKGKGSVEVWDVAKKKKLGTVKYAKGNYKCGEARMLGTTLYVSASVCAGPSARGWLFKLKGGKSFASVGGKEFGTYGTVPLQIGETTWAFLDENAATIAIQDVATGKLVKTIDIGPLWAGGGGGGDSLDGAAGDDALDEDGEGEDGEGAAEDEMPMPAMGNPGESALVRGAEGKLIVVTGGPGPGSVGVIDIETGALVDQSSALQCAPSEAPVEEPAGDEESAEEEPVDD